MTKHGSVPHEFKNAPEDKAMTAAETIEHFENMGALDEVVKSQSGRILLIRASGADGYAQRCMKDLRESDGYYEGTYGIDGVTTDGVPVSMTFL